MRISDWSSDVCSSDLQWKRLITESGRIDRRRYEIAIMATLRDRLRAGDVWIEGTRNYQRFDAYLLGRRDAAKVADVLPFDSNAASYLADRARNLDWRSEERRVGKECVSTCRSRWAPYH